MNNKLNGFKFISFVILVVTIMAGCESKSLFSYSKNEVSTVESEISSQEIVEEESQDPEEIDSTSTEVSFEFLEQDESNAYIMANGLPGQTINISYEPNAIIAGNNVDGKNDSFILDDTGSYRIVIPIDYLNIDENLSTDSIDVTIVSQDGTEEESQMLGVYVSSNEYEKYITESGKKSFQNYPPSEFSEMLALNNQSYKWAYTFMTTSISGLAYSYVETADEGNNRYHIQAFYFVRHNPDLGIDYGSEKLEFLIPVKNWEFNFPLSGTDPFSSAYYTSSERTDVIEFAETIEAGNIQEREMAILMTNQQENPYAPFFLESERNAEFVPVYILGYYPQ